MTTPAKAERTPGPWTLEDRRAPHGGGACIDIRAAGDIWVGSILGRHDGDEGFPTDAECEANAALIAAAPALLEALEAVLPLAVSYAADQHHALDHPRNTPYLNTLDEAIDAAHAALASAAERKAGRG